MMLCSFVALICLLLIAYSYLVFPWLMRRAARKTKTETGPLEEFPTLSVLMAVHNEERILEKKIRSIFRSRYPKQKLEVWVGSDASSDQTDEILTQLSAEFPQLNWKPFGRRTGKPAIVNALAAQASGEILVVTDADALFNDLTLAEMVLPFTDPAIGAVQACADAIPEAGGDVGAQERAYTRREMLLKEGESAYGAVIGGFGAAYALRKELFRPVPPSFVVDDFFTFADLLNRGFQTRFSPAARVMLGLSSDSRVQFRRKRRIGRGNFQNLWHFRRMWLGERGVRIAWLFWSHKGIRWVTPLLLLLFMVCAGLSPWNSFNRLLALTLAAFVLLAAMDILLARLNIHLRPIRYLRHFLWMNLALLAGMWDALAMKNANGIWDNQKPTDSPAL
jgi:cellulose synthase/poly-beta-1,6-N-acetylglucosamine synthase-like glycosyltransferase